MTYAKRTKVSVDQSRTEIERLVNKAGATAFSYAANQSKAQIQFELQDRVVRFLLPFPSLDEIKKQDKRSTTIVQREDLREQAIRARWRALKICILAKLESMQAGIEAFEEAFLGQIVDPASNRTVYEALAPRLAERYADNPRPLALPAPEDVTA